ncbi:MULTISPECIES: TRAP transporter large permease [Halomonas]|uniref:TRAP transporter large permease protein n=3 Tax=Halomonas TaxID=2745 RepID=A0AAU7KEI3_9GAMM|nr:MULTISPECIES: TRAP transporter large permease [Halomonas]MBR9771547.1 TRAP transporter large permease [Gammaproteobacteria bacterium]KJZ15502.1 C4-dicarboxylate ABC transporter permease [Halomonas sp. S2151]MAR73413.1 TRAP transporter large permease [Halomonas sp.]MAY70806.1 TRAP transporter large permease [Halomonas sp.]MBR9882016.1 TRAP transporter large permease [Gammaproteobacteria bacterium]|tara:strand:- start:590 stop:1858 length:1269 start_codon:yes stop_codon:yes gene_type:complete
MALLLFVLLISLFILGVPIAFSLGLASAITVWHGDLMPMLIVAQQMLASVNSFPLMAIPFFILAGYLMQGGGISKRLVDFSNTLVGSMTGGLAMVAIVTSLFFAAISGSGAATTAAIGAILIPAMLSKGYPGGYAAANQAASGALGVIIPPSIPLILYGIAANVSVGDMFIAGILPGILVTLTLLVFAYFFARANGLGGGEKSSLGDVFRAGKKAILAILMPVIILGGIYGGVFTPTEAAVIAVAYSFVIGTLIYREIKFASLVGILKQSAVTTAVVLSIIGAAGLYGRILQSLRVPDMISDFVISAIDSPLLFILLANLLLLLAGMFIEAAAAILIFVPILLPIAVSYGFDPIHFGIIMVVNLAMGMFTPPVGLNLFVASQITNIGIARLTWAVMPFVAIVLANLLIISLLPVLSTWLPSL